MSDDTQPSTTPLPESIETAIEDYYDVVASAATTWNEHVAAKQALVAVFAAALSEARKEADPIAADIIEDLYRHLYIGRAENEALRERAERLRQGCVMAGVGEFRTFKLDPGDLADDLIEATSMRP